MADEPAHLPEGEREDRREEVPEARATPGRWRWGLVIWVVPVVALAVGAWLALGAVLNRGPTVAIVFKTATGLEAGKTKVKYKDVDIGTVKSIGLSEDHADVIVTAELTPQAKGLIVEDTQFWVVRPRISGGQAFGLGTILSGAYIALDPGKSKTLRRAFEGLENPPVVTSDVPGRQFVLRAGDLGSIDIGSPVYYRHLRVGQVVSADLDKDGRGVTFQVFVNAPYDRYITSGTRFWNASGIDASFDASGFRLDTESLLSMIIGGVAFQVPPEADAGTQAPPQAVFELFKDRDTAFRQIVTVREVYVLYFRQSVRGLTVGAPVDFRGVPVGEVARVGLDYDSGNEELRSAVEIYLYPQRVASRLRKPVELDRSHLGGRAMQRLVEHGLRATLRTGNLLTSQLYVALDYFPKSPKAALDLTRAPMELPTAPGGFSDLQTSMENIASSIEKVPFDQLAADLRSAVKTLDATMRKVDTLVERVDTELAPELRSTLQQARETLHRAEGALSGEGTQGDVRGALRDVSRAAEAMRSLTDYLERHPEAIIRGKQEEPAR